MATASNNRDKHKTFDADFKEDFTEGMLRMLSEGSSNDVRIILSDGEVTANKDVLAAHTVPVLFRQLWVEGDYQG